VLIYVTIKPSMDNKWQGKMTTGTPKSIAPLTGSVNEEDDDAKLAAQASSTRLPRKRSNLTSGSVIEQTPRKQTQLSRVYSGRIVAMTLNSSKAKQDSSDEDDADCSSDDGAPNLPRKAGRAEHHHVGDDETQRLAMRRKRNAIYSKRKYYKKKREVERLERTRYELESSNLTLKLDNQRLEKLLQEAQDKVALHKSLDLINLEKLQRQKPTGTGGPAVLATASNSNNNSNNPFLAQLQGFPGLLYSPSIAAATVHKNAAFNVRMLAGGGTTTVEALQQGGDRFPATLQDTSHSPGLIQSLLARGQGEYFERQLQEQAEVMRRTAQERERMLVGLLSQRQQQQGVGRDASSILADLQMRERLLQQQAAAAIGQPHGIQGQISALLSTSRAAALGGQNHLSSSLMLPPASQALPERRLATTGNLQQPLQQRGGASSDGLLLQFLLTRGNHPR
jgi:hypothetical protein